MRTDVHVISESVLCVGGLNAVANEARATEISQVWDPITFMEKDDITGRPVQFHLATHSAPDQIWDPKILRIHKYA